MHLHPTSLQPMRMASAIAALLAGVLALAGCFQAGAPAGGGSPAAGNLLGNSGFEGTIGQPPEQWNIEAAAAGKGAIALVADPATPGSTRLKLAPNDANTSIELTQNPLGVGQGLQAGPYRGRKLHVAARMSAEGGAQAITTLIALHASGRNTAVRLVQPSAPGAMVAHQDVLDVPEGGDVVAIILLCLAEGTTGAAYFDDVYLGLTPPGGAAAAPAEAPSGPLTATVSVDAAGVLRPIPRTLYGTNLQWYWGGNGVWDVERDRLDPTVAELTEELGVSLLRFGGDFYDWRKGIGPRSKRPEVSQAPGSDKTTNAFGTDEAIQFAGTVGAELFGLVNITTGTPEDAADWVRYINQKGHHVTYWEVGNEQYIAGEAPHVVNTTRTPQKYVEDFRRYAKALRAADPSIKLGAILDENYGRSPTYYQQWSETVLKELGGEIDFVAVHNAYAPALWQDEGWDLRTVYAAMLSAPQQIRASLDRTNALIARHAAQHASRIEVAVTEWGPYFQITPDGRFLDHVKTLGSALFVASTMKEFIEGGVDIACFYHLSGRLWMGWLGERNGEFISTAPSMAFSMFSRHFGDELVASTATSPTFRSASIGWVDAAAQTPYLDVIASRSRDGRTLSIIGINKHFDQPIKATITIGGARPSGDMTATTLTGAGIDAHTGTQLFQAPGVRWAAQADDGARGRFRHGGPGEITLESTAFSAVGATFEHTFPARSVTSLELRIAPAR
jgi:alpha-N-arabinofuranosidase